MTVAVIVGVVVVLWVIAYLRVPLLVSTVLAGMALAALTYFHPVSNPALVTLWVAFLLLAAGLNVPPLRRALISNRLLILFRKLMPPVSTDRAGSARGGDRMVGGRV